MTPAAGSQAVAHLVSEKDFQQAVREYAQAKGWTVFSTHDSRRSPEGEPDLRLARPTDGRVIFAELKSMKGRLTAAQSWARAVLEACPGVEYYLLRPSDWPLIEKILE